MLAYCFPLPVTTQNVEMWFFASEGQNKESYKPSLFLAVRWVTM